MTLIERIEYMTDEIIFAIAKESLVIFPTETIYGIGCNALQDKAVKQVLEIKGRGLQQPPPVLVANDEQLKCLVSSIPHHAEAFIKKFWPGSLTIIFSAREEISDVLCGFNAQTNTRTVGVRMTAHPVARQLCERCEVPIVATSANYSGATGNAAAPRVLDDIPGDFKEKVDYVIDGGAVAGAPSTIVDCSGAVPVLLRAGAVELQL